MKMTLKKVVATNFKGFDNFEVTFKDGKNIICGQNGLGKTSLLTAIIWAFCDKDYDLNSNPNIRPDDAKDEAIPTVFIEGEVDGKPFTVKKSQKFKRSKPDAEGITKTSTTNAYELNSVELSARDFEKRLSEDYGVDFEKFLQLCHPNVFVSGMKDKKSRDDMRATLFAMADGVSDLDIAKSDEKLSDVAGLLENYRYDEIESMSKASIRKIGEVYGKSGEIIDAEIRGLETAKSDVPMDELENKKKGIENQIDSLDKQIAKGKVDISDLETELNKVNLDISRCTATADEALREKRSSLKDSLSDAERELKNKKFEKSTYSDRIINANNDIRNREEKLERMKEDYLEVKSHKMSANATKCPACGREFDKDRIDEITKHFTEERTNKLIQIDKIASETAESIDNLNKDIDAWNEKISIIEKEIDTIEQLVEGIKKEIDNIPDTPDYEDSDKYKELITRKDKIEVEMAEKMANSTDTSKDEALRDSLKEQLQEIIEQIGKIKNNSTIDEKIEALRQKRIDLEQQKADAEKILYQLSILSMRKNEMLEEQVNKHFEIVKWRLFDVQKNGATLDACIPFIDGFRFGQSTNTGRELLAKIDIIRGLQTFYDMHLPVFIDGAECISENTENRIEMDCQAFFLKVTEDDELQFM